MKKIAVIGAGSWGTALAVTAAAKGHAVKIWGRNKRQMESMRETGENKRYLPGVKLPPLLRPVDEAQKTVHHADLVLFSVPAQAFRSSYTALAPILTAGQVIVNVAKGIEKGTLLRMSEVAEQVAPEAGYVVLSGPSHAEEVGKRLPTTVTVGSRRQELAAYVQDVFITDKFRVYTSDDVTGMELGGSLKNIIALGAGISDGMGYGDNAKAALMTRGLAEMNRLAVRLGARQETLSGLAGVGDLIVTCTSMHSRNRRCGIMIGQGVPVKNAVEKVGMVVEGISTTEAAHDLAVREHVEMPITEAIYRILCGEISAAEAEPLLMGRKPKPER